MKPAKSSAISPVGLFVMVVLAIAGCRDLVLDNVAAGLREGTLTTATGIIEGFFEQQFGLPASGDESREEEEGGNDLFIRP